MRATEVRQPLWIVGVLGLVMIYLATLTVILTMYVGWQLTLGLGAGLVFVAWQMRAIDIGRSLRFILFGVGVVSLVMGTVFGLGGGL